MPFYLPCLHFTIFIVMKTYILLPAIAVLDLILQRFFGFWAAGLVAFLICLLFAPSGSKAFLAGFGAIVLVWLGMTLASHLASGGILTQRMANVFSLPNSWLLVLVTVVMGGLIGGISGLAGYHTANLFKK